MKTGLLCRFMLLFCVSSFSQSSIIWERTYGGSESDLGKAITQTTDGGFVFISSVKSIDGEVVGNNFYPNLNILSYGVWLVKIDGNGNIVWKKCFNGPKDDKGYDIIQTNDNGFLISTTSKSDAGDFPFHIGSDSFEDIWIFKLNSTGDLEWNRHYGGGSPDQINSIQQTADGGFVLAGSVYLYPTQPFTYTSYAGYNYWVLKLNSSGELEWNRVYGGENFDIAHSIKQTIDGGYIIAGESSSNYGDISNSVGPFTAAIPNFWIVKIDSVGNIQWDKSLGGSNSDIAFGMDTTIDGGYIICGETSSNNTGNITNYHGNGDAWIIKLNSIGNLEWQKTIGGSNRDSAHMIVKTADAGYVFVGETSSSDGDLLGSGVALNFYSWIVKLDANGSIIWQKFPQNCYHNKFENVVNCNDGSLIAIGDCIVNDLPNVYIAKFSETLSNNELQKKEFIIYPNPVSKRIYIETDDDNFISMKVYDSTSRIIKSNIYQNNIDVSDLANGIYYLEIISKDGTLSYERFIKKN